MGRTSFLWAAGAVVVLAVSWLTSQPPAIAPGGEYQVQDTYYVVAHVHLVFGLSAAFLLFAAIYLALERWGRGRRRGFLGGLHLALTSLGAGLMFAPIVILRLHPPAPADDLSASFQIWNHLSSAGYALTLLGLCFFVLVLIDAFRRSPVSR